MRKSVLLVLMLAVGLLAASAAPASAAPANKTTVDAIECYGVPDFSEARVWLSDGNMHVRGAVNTSVQWTHDGDWVEYGTNTILLNFNAPYELVDGMPQPVFPEMTQWGTFASETADGDFAGSWAIGRTTVGHATGNGVGDSAGMHQKVKLIGEPPSWWDGTTPPGCFAFGFLEITVIDPHA